nr:hypothetical protein [Actinomycetales bacterium]
MELYERGTSETRLDPLGREVFPNEPLPRRPWWQLLLAAGGLAASVIYMLMFAQSLIDNISTEDPTGQSFVATGVALMGFLLSLALFLGYQRWFTRYGNLTGLVTLLIVTVAPPVIRYL